MERVAGPLANGGPVRGGLGRQSEPVGDGGRLAAVGGAELAEDVGDVDAGVRTLM
jgi:hypothetical protein